MEIHENMEVIDANDQHVGIVGKVEGERITLKEAIDAQRPFVEKSQVASIEGNKVKLSQQTSRSPRGPSSRGIRDHAALPCVRRCRCR